MEKSSSFWRSIVSDENRLKRIPHQDSFKKFWDCYISTGKIAKVQAGGRKENLSKYAAEFLVEDDPLISLRKSSAQLDGDI